ncbi:MAG TPA: RNA polymerase sigma-70 factor [Streptosporangiaceae bacterium]|nr:RNA polymerase sigma-70 factor [Streptosporangiaceae bacterium]
MTAAENATAQAYESLRPLMFSIAYRMLGSVTEAEDIVQDAFVRYYRAVSESGPPDSPKAYLSAVVTRLCIDHLRSARVRRESYVGEWLPEPLVTGPDRQAGPAPDPADLAEQADSLSMAFLLVLERLTPVERAVFLLHDIFSYDYDETAAIVGRNAVTCRQLAHRARQHVDEHRPRFETTAARRDELAARFFDAVGSGDLDGLVSLLAEDVTVYGDNGGVSPSWPRPITGRDPVGRLLTGIGAQLRDVHAAIEPIGVNGQPGALIRDPEGRLISVFVLDIAGDQVHAIRSVINPDKLRHLGPLADVPGLREQRRASRRAEPPAGGPRSSGRPGA